jgi:membrane protease YdiL (CAAX protease family)
MTLGERREGRFALVAVLAWSFAAALAHRTGWWLSFGSVAILFGTLTLIRDRAVRTRLIPNRRYILLGLAIGSFMIAATYVLAPVLESVPSLGFQRDLRALYSSFRAPSPWAAVMLGPIVLGEEIIWRGLVQGSLEPRMGANWAAALSVAAYAIAYVPTGPPLLILVALACGTVWGTLRAVTGHLVPSLVSHALWDAVVLLVYPVLK